MYGDHKLRAAFATFGQPDLLCSSLRAPRPHPEPRWPTTAPECPQKRPPASAPFPGAMATQITLRSAEGDNFEVDEAVAFESQMIKNMIEGAWKKRTHNSALGGGVCECKSFLEALRPALPR